MSHIPVAPLEISREIQVDTFTLGGSQEMPRFPPPCLLTQHLLLPSPRKKSGSSKFSELYLALDHHKMGENKERHCSKYYTAYDRLL
jgi:hypothetical protein